MGKILSSVGQATKITGKTLLLAGCLSYLGSEKIGYVKHTINKQLIENLELKTSLQSDTLYETDDRETNTILNMMSGYTENDDLQKLFQKYGEEKICIDAPSIDPAMYKTIRTMQQKYGNPHVRFRGNYSNYDHVLKNEFRGKNTQLAIEEGKRARYNFATNSMYLHNLDSLRLNFTECKSPQQESDDRGYEMRDGHYSLSSVRDEKRYLINNRMFELSHVYQNMHMGAVRFGVDGLINYIGEGFNYDSTYTHPGSIEHEAHKVIQPKLVEEFIDTYISNSDTTDAKQCFFISMLYNEYFDNFKDDEKGLMRLKKIAGRRTSNMNYIIGKKMIKQFENMTDTATNAETNTLFQGALSYLELSARQGSYEAINTIVYTIKECYLPHYLNKAIYRQTYLIEHHELYMKNPHFVREPAKEYMKLAKLYTMNNQPKEAKKYEKKAAEHGFDTTIDNE